MSDTKRPYFLWDYDLTEDDVRRILREGTEVDEWGYEAGKRKVVAVTSQN